MDLMRFANTPKAPPSARVIGERVAEVPETQVEGMQVKLGPETFERAPETQYSPQLECRRVPLLAGGVFTMNVTNIPRRWAVVVNANSAAGSVVQVQSGVVDLSLGNAAGAKGSCIFPGRVTWLTVTAGAGAAPDVTIFAIGDDELSL